MKRGKKIDITDEQYTRLAMWNINRLGRRMQFFLWGEYTGTLPRMLNRAERIIAKRLESKANEE